MADKRIIEAEVRINNEIVSGIKKIILYVGKEAAAALPGQFINVYPKADRLILPRPISICDASSDEGTITLIYAIVGEGTKELGEVLPGDIVKITSPLGNGFFLPNTKKENIEINEPRRVVLAGGGVGAAPLYFLAKKLSENQIPITVVLGFRKDTLLVKDFFELGCRVYVTTELPTESAFLGNIVECMEINEVHGDIYYICGPRKMIEAVVGYAEKNDVRAEIQVSLEERMGCGYGACVGCVCDIRSVKEDGSIEIKRLKVCHDGPVFNGKEVIWG